MAKGFIAIDLNKNKYEFSEKGLTEIKRLHETQGISGWKYGKKEDLETLIKSIVTPQEAKNALAENEILKQRIAELEATKTKGAKAQK